MSSVIVGICGFIGAGKSTALAALTGIGFTEGSFAGPMKRFAGEVYGFHKEDLYGPSKNRSRTYAQWGGLTPRKALQTLGAWGRAMHPDTWVRMAIRESLDRGVDVAFQDLRYPNEAECVHRNGGIVLYVHRPSAVPPWYRRPFLHESERAVFSTRALPFVQWIDNTGTLGQLESSVRRKVALHTLRG